MKRILTSLALLGAFGFTASAQSDTFKTIDLSIAISNPTSNSSRPNLNAGDTFRVLSTLTNLGPDIVMPSDTIVVSAPIGWLGHSDLVYSSRIFGDTIPVNGTRNITFTFVQGATVPVQGGSPIVLVIPSDQVVDNIEVNAYGYSTIAGSSTAYLYTDDGIDLVNDEIQYGGNNLANPTGVRFGTVGVFDVKGLAKTDLNVYPNPAKEKVSFKASLVNAEATVRVLDIAGRTVLVNELGKQVAGEKEITVDVTSLNNGMYYVELVNGENRATSKITVQK